MGDDAVDGAADADADRGDGRGCSTSRSRAGALGFSSSLGEAHTDGDGNPVPSRAPSPDEFLALAGAVRDHAGTTLEFIAAMGEIPTERIELMADMSLAADRPLNWNLLGSLSPTEVYEQQLTSCDHAAEHGRPRRRARAPRPHAHARQQHARATSRVGATSSRSRDDRAARRVADPDVRAAGCATASTKAASRGLGAHRPSGT